MAIDFPVGLGNIVYEYDYYAGTQTLVYFHNVLVEDILRIGYSIQQNRVPVYGYASQYYNAIPDGNVIVNGSFWIAFKEAGYIPIILRYISGRLDPGGQGFFSSPAIRPRSGSEYSTGLIDSAREWEGQMATGNARRAGSALRANVERLLERYAENPDDAQVQAELQDLAVQLQSLPDRDFEDLAELFEDALWYGGNQEQGSREEILSGNFRGGDMTDEDLLRVRRADQYPPFDIFITFGDINNRAANHTLVRILSAQIVNTEFGPVENSGEPVYVRYDFFARSAA